MSQGPSNVLSTIDHASTAFDYSRGNREMTQSRRRVWSVCGLAGALLLAVTGCGGNEEPKSPAETRAAEKQAALDTYDQHWTSREKIFASASLEDSEVEENTSGKALAEIQRTAGSLKQNGDIFEGGPHRQNSEVTKLSMDSKTPRAEILECTNVRTWIPVNKKTKEPAPLPSDRLTRHVQTAVAEKQGEKWMITEVTPKAKAC